MTQKKIKLMLYLGMIFLVLGIVNSTPVPYGIDGVVYGLNGDRANSSVNVSIYNLNTSFFVQGNLRKDGSYSASIVGESGDTIIVKVWTKYNIINRSFVVEDEMHGYNLSLNLSSPQPPLPAPSPEDNTKKNKRRFMRRPRVITGLITMDDEPVESGLEYELTNLETGETIEGEIQDKFNAFAEVIKGNDGDLLQIEVGDENYNEKNIFPITGEVIRKDIDMNISKFEFGFIKLKNKYGVYIIGGLLFVLIALIFGLTNKKT